MLRYVGVQFSARSHICGIDQSIIHADICRILDFIPTLLDKIFLRHHLSWKASAYVEILEDIHDGHLASKQIRAIIIGVKRELTIIFLEW